MAKIAQVFAYITGENVSFDFLSCMHGQAINDYPEECLRVFNLLANNDCISILIKNIELKYIQYIHRWDP